MINGRTFNPARADAFPEIDSTETWEIVNKTTVAHLMHLHHTDWYLLERNGKPPPPWEDCLKETFFIFPDERILVAGHFSRLPRQVRDPLPHARPRGPRPDVPVRGREETLRQALAIWSHPNDPLRPVGLLGPVAGARVSVGGQAHEEVRE